jgi:hypothetical protein
MSWIRKSTRSRVVIACVSLVVALGAVAAHGWTTHGRGAVARSTKGALIEHDEPNSDRPDWSAPFVDGVAVRDLAAARGKLDFVPGEARNAGKPRKVFVHGRGTRRADQAIALVYDSAQYGRFFVIQSLTRMTQRQLDAIPASCQTELVCAGTWTTITLPSGVRALLVDGPVSKVVMWLRGRVRMVVVGSSETFTAAAAQAVAADIAAS